jgi:hypothetical protein
MGELMVIWEKVTPALYGITKKIATPTIIKKWDGLIVPILQNENLIYKEAFYAFSFSHSVMKNCAFGFEIFQIIMRHEVPLEQELILAKPKILAAVFDEYWLLAEDPQFWLNGCFPNVGNQVPFEQALLQWERKNNAHIVWCEECLRQWQKLN